MKKIKVYIVLLIITPILISCDFGSGMDLDEDQYKTNLFLVNINDSTTQFISEGYNPIFLNNSNRILFRNVGLWIYKIESGESIQMLDNFHSHIDENSISPDEKYLIYRNKNDLLRLDLNSFETMTLINSPEILNSYPLARYSNEGNQIIYTTSPKQKNDFSNFDSVYIHIYNFDTQQIITLDTLYDYKDASYSISFTKNSQKLYVIQSTGYDYDIGKNRHNIGLFTNNQSPKLISSFTVHRSTGWERFWDCNNETIIYIELNGIYHYDLNSALLINRYSYNTNLNLGSMRFIKNTDQIVGADTNSVIEILNLEGIIQDSYNTNIEGYIYWIDYSESLEKIVVATEVKIDN